MFNTFRNYEGITMWPNERNRGYRYEPSAAEVRKQKQKQRQEWLQSISKRSRRS